ncbi:hypothetical protein PPYR_01106 [Photinus pyralis]|uniref:RecF/RecN/SMC N-terminal domain-containing protein n=1 Tax=Photinus pyralis TaxID=7054 RepID=A0A1Y1M1F1_PHOPY|nr:structural maintenance of chromosomes protein 6 isoform X2 [Photinus pyralis]KAB0804136.1 hypothetical protein PPYR_01106 [Photinus pyralis]
MASRKRKPLSQLSLEEQEKRKRNSEAIFTEGTDTRAGTISRMVLKNFMCHAHLEVVFDQNINYLIGRNGSGKSAILTSLVIGLGGKASFTNRGSSVKGFIKAGKNSASVEVTLRNAGPLAYKYNDYGDEITIVRNFTAAGNSSYKIKSATGEVISTQVKEIHRVCSYLNIQVDNPICLLNQDTSRNFLNSKDPRQKFLLFMRATRLEALWEEYVKILTSKKDADRMFKEKEKLHSELQQELSVLKRKMIDQKSVCALKQQVKVLQTEILWAKVQDAEIARNSEQETVNKLREQETQIVAGIGNEDRILMEYQQQISNLQNLILTLQHSIEEQNEPQSILVRILGELKETLTDKRREKRIVMKDIAVKTGNCNILEQEINNFNENYDQIEQEKAKRAEEMATLEEKIRSIEGLLETSKNDQYQMRNSVNRAQEEERNVLMEMRGIDSEIDKTQTRLNAFKANSDVLSLYGSDMPRIVQAIKQAESQFTHVPRGPLGSYITLKDKKWAVAVEGFLTTGLLRAFAVDNKRDNELLMKILQRTCSGGQKPMVITGKFFFQVHDVRPNLVRPVDGCLSVFSALEISDPVVTNCLIDQVSLESVLLIPDTNTAINLMSNQSHVPQNCRQGITMKGDKYYPDPNYKTYASRYHTAQYLQVSTADVIQQLENHIMVLQDKKKTMQSQLQTVKRDCSEQSRSAKDLEVKVNKLGTALLHLKRKLSDLQGSDEPDVANITMLKNELAELKRAVEARSEVESKIQADLAELQTKIEKKEEKLEKIKHIVRGYEDRMDPLNLQIREKHAQVKEFEVNKRFANNRLAECRSQLRQARAVLDEKQKLVQLKATEAGELGSRPSKIRTVPVALKELSDTERHIRRIESNLESYDVTKKKYEACKDQNKQASEFIKCVRCDVQLLKAAVENCLTCYSQTEDYFVTFIQHAFEEVLQLRQFQGSLKINMGEKKLELVVIPQQGSQGHTTTSNLSGGERSFSTVAFLYSLWQCMDFPFYFLDEFDVFMDKVNRTKVMEILLYHAKKHKDMQFVFLTPQDISFVNDPLVAIHRLQDPERGMIQ